MSKRYLPMSLPKILPLSMTAIATVLATGATAEPNPPCGPRDRIVSHLQKTYGEARSGAGIGSETSVVEVWTSADSGTWTILLTRANGTSCILASGENWHEVPRTLSAEPA